MEPLFDEWRANLQWLIRMEGIGLCHFPLSRSAIPRYAPDIQRPGFHSDINVYLRGTGDPTQRIQGRSRKRIFWRAAGLSTLSGRAGHQ